MTLFCRRRGCSLFQQIILCFFTGCEEYDRYCAGVDEELDRRPEVRQAARSIVDEFRERGLI